MDLATLGEHKTQCTAPHGRLVALQCGLRQLLGVTSSRLVSTVALLSILILAALMLL